MSSNTENINNNNFKKNAIIFIACLFVAIGIMTLFFTDYIFSLNDIVKNKTQSIYYFKWIILGFLLNIIFLITLNSMKSYKNNIIGDKGPQGFQGKKGQSDTNCVICTGSGDHDFEYDLETEFNENNWEKK